MSSGICCVLGSRFGKCPASLLSLLSLYLHFTLLQDPAHKAETGCCAAITEVEVTRRKKCREVWDSGGQLCEPLKNAKDIFHRGARKHIWCWSSVGPPRTPFCPLLIGLVPFLKNFLLSLYLDPNRSFPSSSPPGPYRLHFPSEKSSHPSDRFLLIKQKMPLICNTAARRNTF